MENLYQQEHHFTPPPHEIPDREVACEMLREDGQLIKNDLQISLFNAVHREEYQAYNDTEPAFTQWITHNSTEFEKFFDHYRFTAPEKLVEWYQELNDNDELNDADFIRSWMDFKLNYHKSIQ